MEEIIISSTFIRERGDGFHRLMLNVKRLNIHLEYNHFQWKLPFSFMTAIDLKGAYYPVKKAHVY